MFAGPEKLNADAAFLKSNFVLLWIVRPFLSAAILFDSVSAYQIARRRREGHTSRRLRLGENRGRAGSEFHTDFLARTNREDLRATWAVCYGT